MVTFDEKSLMLFILNIMIAGMACDSAITSFMQEDAPRPRKTEKKIVKPKSLLQKLAIHTPIKYINFNVR